MKLYFALGILTLLLIGCTSSFTDCQNACIEHDPHSVALRQNYIDNKSVPFGDIWSVRAEREEYCYEQCKPK